MVVNRITSDKKVWIDTMMKDELGLTLEKKSPFKSGLSTLLSFIPGGLPLIAYIFAYSGQLGLDPFILSFGVTLFAFLLIGYIKTYLTKISLLRSLTETMLLGANAATAAFLLLDYLEKIIK
jgi:VIT1/CCC1 family predicted Fe2+/Mn2+ transporter